MTSPDPVATPPQAITAATEWLHDEECDDGDTETCGRWKCGSDPGSQFHSYHVGHVNFYRERAAIVLEAAAPHLAAFPCCPTACDDDCEQPCHEVHDIPSHRDHNPETCVATIVSAAAAAERERIRQLAGSLKFTLWRPAANGPGGDAQALDVVPLGELLAALREGGDGG